MAAYAPRLAALRAHHPRGTASDRADRRIRADQTQLKNRRSACSDRREGTSRRSWPPATLGCTDWPDAIDFAQPLRRGPQKLAKEQQRRLPLRRAGPRAASTVRGGPRGGNLVYTTVNVNLIPL